MQHFSNEYRDKLIAEHKLISTSLAELAHPLYLRAHGSTTVASAMDDFRVKKVQLEVMIDVLDEYLNK